jgi:DNA-directed RNA polymerase subunit RPC12/RpoP
MYSKDLHSNPIVDLKLANTFRDSYTEFVKLWEALHYDKFIRLSIEDPDHINKQRFVEQLMADMLNAPTSCSIVASEHHGAAVVSPEIPNMYLIFFEDCITPWVLCSDCSHQGLFKVFKVVQNHETEQLELFCPKCSFKLEFVV